VTRTLSTNRHFSNLADVSAPVKPDG
jgi:hypothetical protein